MAAHAPPSTAVEVKPESGRHPTAPVASVRRMSNTPDPADETLAELTRIAQLSAEAYLEGDLDTYAGLVRHADDFSLMAPFGGETRHGFVLSDESRERTRSTF